MLDNLPNLRPYYHVDRLIAEGGTARVYWGIDLRSGFPVAIKELKVQHMQNPKIRDNFIKVETQLYLYLNHPNLPRLVDFIDMRRSGQLFLIMEYVEGKDLSRYIYGMGLVPQEKALPMFLEVLDAVAYLHRQKILHLDIKPNNVMVKADGGIKLIDLGIASRMGNTNTGFGTPPYMPPEQVEKGGQCGAYTDIFALGVMLFEMLTGNLPFNSTQVNDFRLYMEEVRYRIKNDPTPHLSTYYPHIDAGWQGIVEKALAKRPQDRYQSCEEFAQDIRGSFCK